MSRSEVAENLQGIPLVLNDAQFLLHYALALLVFCIRDVIGLAPHLA
jgi:hypothetical protein